MSEDRRYSYDPEKINDGNVDQMRFELGDTVFNPGELTAALTDEEYHAIITRFKGRWNKAKLECLRAILMKFSHQVTMRVGPVSYNFSDRVRIWQEMYDNLKKETSGAVPSVSPSVTDGSHGTPYFYADLHRNPSRGE